MFNKTGDWIAISCEDLGQLLVWEWQSETYVLKQQGHFNNMTLLVYSTSGEYIASGIESIQKLSNIHITSACLILVFFNRPVFINQTSLKRWHRALQE